jgi:hypothetical protein
MRLCVNVQMATVDRLRNEVWQPTNSNPPNSLMFFYVRS